MKFVTEYVTERGVELNRPSDTITKASPLVSNPSGTTTVSSKQVNDIGPMGGIPKLQDIPAPAVSEKEEITEPLPEKFGLPPDDPACNDQEFEAELQLPLEHQSEHANLNVAFAFTFGHSKRVSVRQLMLDVRQSVLASLALIYFNSH